MVNFNNNASPDISAENLNKLQEDLIKKIDGTVLYASATTENVTLSDSVTNYNYLEIYFRKSWSL